MKHGPQPDPKAAHHFRNLMPETRSTQNTLLSQQAFTDLERTLVEYEKEQKKLGRVGRDGEEFQADVVLDNDVEVTDTVMATQSPQDHQVAAHDPVCLPSRKCRRVHVAGEWSKGENAGESFWGAQIWLG